MKANSISVAIALLGWSWNYIAAANIVSQVRLQSPRRA
jgi:hypothetical protein